MNGILLIDKPSGWTSFDVVAKVRGIIKHETGLNKPKVGHTGTLDPLATGLLVLVIGDYCKRAGEFSKLDKVYEVAAKLGQTSTTGDDEGMKTVVSSLKIVDREGVEAVLGRFMGEIMQTPPAYSAIKVGGQRAYKLARAGVEVKIEPRQVSIYSLNLVDYSYPEVTFNAHVGSGTYIRSLVEDLGKDLQVGAYMSNLRRTKVGQWDVQQAVSMEQIDPEQIVANLQTL